MRGRALASSSLFYSVSWSGLRWSLRWVTDHVLSRLSSEWVRAYQDSRTTFPLRSHRETRGVREEIPGWISKSGLPILILPETLELNRARGPQYPSNFSRIICWRWEESNTFCVFRFVSGNPGGGSVGPPLWYRLKMLIFSHCQHLLGYTDSPDQGGRNAKSTCWLMMVGWLYWVDLMEILGWLERMETRRIELNSKGDLQHCHDDPFNWDKGGSGFLIWTRCDDDHIQLGDYKTIHRDFSQSTWF